MENMKIYDVVRKPPASALKQIKGGRLSGMTDIKPQWRYESLTEQFGPCGFGWKFYIDKLWIDHSEQTQEDVANAKIFLYVQIDGEWSAPIPGVGGSMFCAQESKGPHTSDEAYKMAITDALSTACKMLGFGADIYLGMWDGSKYRDEPQQTNNQSKQQKKNPKMVDWLKQKITEDQGIEICDLILESGADEQKFLTHFGVKQIGDIVNAHYDSAIQMLKAKLANAKKSE